VVDAKHNEIDKNELGEDSIIKIQEDQELRRKYYSVPVYGLLVVCQKTNHSKVYDALKFNNKCHQLDLLKLEEGETDKLLLEDF
jgi:hypothetical protein